MIGTVGTGDEGQPMLFLTRQPLDTDHELRAALENAIRLEHSRYAARF